MKQEIPHLMYLEKGLEKYQDRKTKVQSWTLFLKKKKEKIRHIYLMVSKMIEHHLTGIRQSLLKVKNAKTPKIKAVSALRWLLKRKLRCWIKCQKNLDIFPKNSL